ncbi:MULTISPECIES: potassium channel family protein [unclassified Pseudomonas]|uniref:potassium channel family protein n=1 Tax=unclassified Pseudomonas TaxID=196821 RepID=UPI000BA42513|nr:MULTISPECIES: potassium channel family protein [unclassified Pseudomonas]
MLHNLLAGIPVMLLCLLLQGVFVTVCLRQYVRIREAHAGRISQWMNMVLLSTAMLLMLIGNFVQIGIWAALFMLIGEFDDYTTAVYHSGVNFATLGYGDMVMSPSWRLLGPMEAANGILMFGVSTAVMTAAVMDVIKHTVQSLEKRAGR